MRFLIGAHPEVQIDFESIFLIKYYVIIILKKILERFDLYFTK